MSALFADTFYFLALLNPRDQHHLHACQIPAQRTLHIVTTRAVLLEVADAFRAQGSRALAVELLEALEADPTVTIVPLEDALFARGVALYRDRTDKAWSLTDCISFLVMQDHRLSEALTGDRHFEQAGFTRLLGH